MGIDNLALWQQLVLFPLALWILVKGADTVVTGASVIAKRLGIPDLIVGLTIIAIGTSAPEFAVSGFAAWSGAGEISLGNVIGSNIFNLGFILGLCVIYVPLRVPPKMVYRDLVVLIAGSALMGFFAFMDGHLGRVEGIILLLGLASYLFYLSRQPDDIPLETEEEEDHHDLSTRKAFFYVFLGLAGLLLGSRGLVDIATSLAEDFGVSEWLIGVTIVAVGTSLPELVTAIISIKRRNSDLGVGSLIGSDIFNIMGVMGFAAVIRPIEISDKSLVPFYALMATIAFIFIVMRVGWRIGRKEGIVLMMISFGRFIYEISFAS